MTTRDSGNPTQPRHLIQDIIEGGSLRKLDPYQDRSAVHFAVGIVADANYGAERGNEIFFTFPTAFIAANNFYGGRTRLSENHAKNFGITSDWNDVSIWSENNEGISINAGLVFIPADADVDRTNGSKYALDENMQPIPLIGQDGKQTYQLALDTIASEEYWENYFRDYPDQRPKRVIYYEGGDPTQALLEWRKENGLTTFSDSKDLGFPEREIQRSQDPRANHGFERFRSIALKVIEDHKDQIPQEQAA